MTPRQPISDRMKVTIWSLPWLVTFIAMRTLSAEEAVMFPIGLVAWFVPAVMFGWGPFLGIAGWILYGLFTAAALDSRSRGTFLIYSGILVVTLTANSLGFWLLLHR